MIVRISYPVTPDTPLYPGTPPPAMKNHRSMVSGDISNHSLAGFSLHSGTHIDAPRHFCPEGSTVRDLLRPENSYYPSYCLDIPCGPDQCITQRDLDSINHAPFRDAQAILIRTGLSRIRATSPMDYAQKNPVIDPGIVTFLRTAYPSLLLFGIDAISVANHLHKEEGRACHREFLCRDPPVLILEDADLSDKRLGHEPFTLMLYPFFMDETEATPVVAIAQLKDG
ncbi:MAG: Kynurenine formamidase [Methanoregula sp. PtaU1.Bin051]|nr:MAG: Kynurenine formamidase [Methanoregula sp. PtaU1.Bin051]